MSHKSDLQEARDLINKECAEDQSTHSKDTTEDLSKTNTEDILCLLCECGCGQPIPSDGKFRRFLKGHVAAYARQWRWEKATLEISKRTSHRRARRIVKPLQCFVQNNQCSKRLQIAHIDGNPMNNHSTNLICLCVRHHSFLDNSKIPLNELSKERPFIISSNKRRYLDKYLKPKKRR